ncbi:N-(5'-phosphoribosyl)anthranilate isomerase [Yoonia sp. BS5-3]|uniref:N-(5'-phosphoribosyl)anthranilate isomerase n=1 Tax=Yoonia phaeophyticola TaxID=3137369 RepID=A0ABZ2V0C7_9RHOB
MIKRDRNDWLSQVFHCRAAQIGGVIRRQIVDVEREVGVPRFIAEVNRRGFRLIRTEHYFVVVCNNGPIELLC